MTYTTLTGRRFDLSRLTDAERAFLRRIASLFRQQPHWDQFSREWVALGRQILWRDGTVPVGHPVYRICQDLAARRGIAEGRVARPDYRDQLADLIEDRFGSRYRFCKETGIDPAHLSRVLAGKKHFAAETLSKILEPLGVELALVDHVLDPDQMPPSLEALDRETAEI
jgi:Helix-turn-helix